MRYLASDGHVYQAKSAADLIAQMHEMAGTPGSDADWMQMASEGICSMYGKPVRTDNAEVFVDDMLAIGLLKPDRGK